MLRAAAALSIVLIAHAAYADDAVTEASPPASAPQQVIVIEPPSVAAPVATPQLDELPPTMPAAPQNEAWNNVSHINGVPVPVGERNQYLYAIKHTNIAVNPLGLVAGYYEGAVSHALGNNVAISVGVAAQSRDGATAEQVALTLPIYFKKVFTGPFIEPGFVVRSASGDVDDCCDDSSSSTTTTQFEMMIGWSWLFDNGLNMSMAGGIARNLGHNDDDGDVMEEISPAGYFRVGYAF
ncbi:MAG TPA: hypothetical protein VH143_15495 [Kofleriaceae bacterium]|jgi:hypothetical protein|nr:hypothetical protein [Kofleriaceae bacterium]